MFTAPGPVPGAVHSAPLPAVRVIVAAAVRLYRDGLVESLRGEVEVVAACADTEEALPSDL